ncbi:MAG TPA: helix-turn-helix domain-containing protein, partial [Sedimenticola sp.]|nr:helix-turn-helix domain-containing protein [Sedimenticola sp.]
MTQKAVDRQEVIQRVVSRQLRQKEAARLLGLSVRQVKRLVARFKGEGAAGLVSRHLGRRLGNALSDAVRREVLGLVRTHYADFGPARAPLRRRGRSAEVEIERGTRFSFGDHGHRLVPAGIQVHLLAGRRSPAVHPDQACLGRRVAVPDQRLDHIPRPCPRIAYQHHVAAGSERPFGPRREAAGHRGGGHGQVVTEHHPLEAEFSAQDLLQPEIGETGKVGRSLPVDHVGRHDGLDTRLDEPLERKQVLHDHIFRPSAIHRQPEVGILLHCAVPGEMLADRRHPRRVHTGHPGQGQFRHHLGLAMECAVANHLADAGIKVQHRGKTEVDAGRPQLRRHQPACGAGMLQGLFPVAVVAFAIPGGRWQAGETGAETL